MSVYTNIDLSDIKSWLANYDLGAAVKLQPIASGTVNSNYYLTTEKGLFILTLFETLPPETVQTILSLTEYLVKKGVACPGPILDQQQNTLSTLAHKPAAIITCLSGRSLDKTTPYHCQQMGQWLAHMHLAGADYPQHIDNVMGKPWRETLTQKLIPLLSKEEQKLAQQCWDVFGAMPWDHLPNGIIHADLFRDNVLFDNDKLSGVIDFYFACSGAFLYDIAILINDWCRDSYGSLDKEKTSAFLSAYEDLRPLTPIEQENWEPMLVCAASRFWLSRLSSIHFPRGSQSDLVLIKDPNEFKRIIQQHTRNS